MKTIEISTEGSVKCRECGAEVAVDLNQRKFALLTCECECGHYFKLRPSHPTWQDLLKLVGITLELDWDGQLIAHFENWVPEGIEDWLFENQKDIRSSIEFEGKKKQAVYIGGPLDTQRHHFVRGSYNGDRQYQHIKRGHWAVYQFKKHGDPRLYFVGTATSKAKARKI